MAIQSRALTGATQQVTADDTMYHGFTIRETAAAVAVVRIWDNASASSGVLLDAISLAASESAREFYLQGVMAQNGIRVEIVSGTVEGSVRIS